MPADEIDTIEVTAHEADAEITEQIRTKTKNATPVIIVYTPIGHLWFEPIMDLVQRQFLPANAIEKVMPSTPFCILPTCVSGHDVHVPKHMIFGRLCDRFTEIVDRNWLPPTLTEDATTAVCVSIVQTDI